MTKKNLKVLILLSLISIFILVITGCSNDSEDALSSARSYDVNFIVADQGEQAVEAAALTLAGETKTTNIDGFVSFRKANGRYDFEVIAENHDKYSNSIVVDGSDFTVDVKLSTSNTGNSNPGDTGDNTDSNPGDSEEEDDNTPQDPGDSEPEDDTTAPVLTELFAWIDGNFYGTSNLLTREMIKKLMSEDKDLDQSFDYFIVHFNETVKIKSETELNPAEDFELQFETEASVKEIGISKAILTSEFLLLKIDNVITAEMLEDERAEFSLKINESGCKKIFDMAENMLAEDPDTLILEVK